MFDITDSLLISSFFFHFHASCNMQFAMLEFLFDGACGLNTLTSRNVFSWRPPQNPFIETSSLAPSDIIIGGSVSKGFTSQGLEIWFHRDFMADFGE